MLKRLSLEKVELLLASGLATALITLIVDLPYTAPCTFFFGEPEYPIDK
ncbi:MAG: hypothetical protein K2P35_11495 [Lachnospiraceae bacterium]|nr:hypothetical protein [Lachnospiraceae bacterium]